MTNQKEIFLYMVLKSDMMGKLSSWFFSSLKLLIRITAAHKTFISSVTVLRLKPEDLQSKKFTW